MAKKKAQIMTAKQLETYRELLLEKLRELMGDVTSIEETLFQGGGELSSMPVHMADIGSDSFEQEFSLGLMAEEKKLVKEIMAALQRIEEGTYGICEGLGTPIESNRLEAIPWTRYSMEYARMMEKGQVNPNHFKRRPIDIQREEDESGEEEDTDEEEIGDEDFEITGQEMDSFENEDDSADEDMDEEEED